MCLHLICHYIRNFLFHGCRAGCPCTTCIRLGSEKVSRFPQLLMQERKCFGKGQPSIGKTLPVHSCYFSAVSVCSSVYEKRIVFSVLVSCSVISCFFLIRDFTSSLTLHMGTSSSPAGIFIQGILLLPVAYNRNGTLAFPEQ